jgi:surface protein
MTSGGSDVNNTDNCTDRRRTSTTTTTTEPLVDCQHSHERNNERDANTSVVAPCVPTQPIGSATNGSESTNGGGVDVDGSHEHDRFTNTLHSVGGEQNCGGQLEVIDVDDAVATPPVPMAHIAVALEQQHDTKGSGCKLEVIGDSNDADESIRASIPVAVEQQQSASAMNEENNRGVQQRTNSLVNNLPPTSDSVIPMMQNDDDDDDDNAVFDDDEEYDIEQPNSEPTSADPSLPLIEATLVDEAVYPAVVFRPYWWMRDRKRALDGLILVISAIVIASVAVPSIIFSSDRNDNMEKLNEQLNSDVTWGECFLSEIDLRNAIYKYAEQDCSNNNDCEVGKKYGWPMNSWCVSNVRDMGGLFVGPNTFNEDISAWDVSSVTSMNHMFQNAAAFNCDLSRWNVSSVTDMEEMFDFAVAFNGDISTWDVSSVTDMSSMFHDAVTFNGNLSSWDVSSVTDMSKMFSGAKVFNGDLSSWDVSSVTTMNGIFSDANVFNGNVSSWNVSSVTDMENMFSGALAFNGDISTWDVSSVTLMDGMFYFADSFNGNLSSWNISSLFLADYMFFGASSFNQDLCNWLPEFPYGFASAIFSESGCTFQADPNLDQRGPFCASSSCPSITSE